MTTPVNDIASFHRSIAVGTAQPEYLDMRQAGFPATVSVIPGGGGSLSVAFSTTPNAVANPGAATWFNWPAGAVNAPTSDALVSPISALRFTATTAAGTAEVVA